MTVEVWETFVPLQQITMALLFALGLVLGVILGSKWRVHFIPSGNAMQQAPSRQVKSSTYAEAMSPQSLS